MCLSLSQSNDCVIVPSWAFILGDELYRLWANYFSMIKHEIQWQQLAFRSW